MSVAFALYSAQLVLGLFCRLCSSLASVRFGSVVFVLISSQCQVFSVASGLLVLPVNAWCVLSSLLSSSPSKCWFHLSSLLSSPPSKCYICSVVVSLKSSQCQVFLSPCSPRHASEFWFVLSSLLFTYPSEFLVCSVIFALYFRQWMPGLFCLLYSLVQPVSAWFVLSYLLSSQASECLVCSVFFSSPASESWFVLSSLLSSPASECLVCSVFFNL